MGIFKSTLYMACTKELQNIKKFFVVWSYLFIDAFAEILVLPQKGIIVIGSRPPVSHNAYFFRL